MARMRLLSLALVAALALAPGVAAAATWYANSSTGNDTTGNGSAGNPYATFHKAYTVASAGDTIDLTGTFDWSTAGESGDSATTGYTIGKNLTIRGQGPAATIVQAASADNTAARRVFTISSGVSATTTDLTIRYGKVGSSQYGGGIEAIGRLYMDSCDVSYNRATDGGGGGVAVWSSATIVNSAIHHNVASYMGGGLLRHYYSPGNGTPSVTDTLDVISSTVYSNQVTQTVAYLEGGGIFYRRGAGTITNTTVTANQVTNGGSSKSTHGVGTGDGAGTVQLKNSIIAGNVLSSQGGDIGHRENGYGVYQDNGGNVIGRRGYYSGGYSSFASTTWVDASTYNLSVDGTYVKQDGSGSNTGSLYLDSAAAQNSAETGTYTFALTSASSVAVNAGLSGTNGATTTVPSTDQRGAARSGAPDAGAYEYGGALSDVVAPTVSVTEPDEGDVVAGAAVTLSADASDDVAVAGVKFYVAGALVGSEDTSSPYTVSWDSTGGADGEYELEAVARDAAGNVATSTAVSFDVDNSVPGFSAVTASSTGSGAVITWTTDAETSSWVELGLSASGLSSSTPETDTSPRVTSHSVTVSGLPACTLFRYRAAGQNAALTEATSSVATFRTAGCTGQASVSSTEDDAIEVASGGSLASGELTLVVPVGFTGTSSAATFQVHRLAAEAFFGSAGSPSGKSRAGDTAFRLTALIDATTTLETFDEPLEVSLSYDDADIDGLDESSLRIYRYDDEWAALESCAVDEGGNSVTCETSHFSDFSIFGDEAEAAEGAAASARRGVSVRRRAVNLREMGNDARADELVAALAGAPAAELPVAADAGRATGSVPAPKEILSVSRDLARGASGDDVAALQNFLVAAASGPAAAALAEAGVIGFFGDLTRAALAEYQAANAIYPSAGYFGPFTRAHLAGPR